MQMPWNRARLGMCEDGRKTVVTFVLFNFCLCYIQSHVQYPHCEREDFTEHDSAQIASLNDTLALLEKNKSLFSSKPSNVGVRILIRNFHCNQ